MRMILSMRLLIFLILFSYPPTYGNTTGVIREIASLYWHHPYIAIVSTLMLQIIIKKTLNCGISWSIKHSELSWLSSFLYFLGGRVNPEVLRKACTDDNNRLIKRCLDYNVNPCHARYYPSSFGPKLLFPNNSSALQALCYHKNKDDISQILDNNYELIHELDYNLYTLFDTLIERYKNDVDNNIITNDETQNIYRQIIARLIDAGGLQSYIYKQKNVKKLAASTSLFSFSKSSPYDPEAFKRITEEDSHKYTPQAQRKKIENKLFKPLKINYDSLLDALVPGENSFSYS